MKKSRHSTVAKHKTRSASSLVRKSNVASGFITELIQMPKTKAIHQDIPSRTTLMVRKLGGTLKESACTILGWTKKSNSTMKRTFH